MDVWIFIISLVASFIFSLGGVGAAIILIPVMVWMGIPLATARPVGLFYNMLSMAGASVGNIKNKRLDFKIGLPIIVASFVFAFMGAYLAQFLPGRIVLLLFIAFLVFSSLMFLFYKRKRSVRSYRSVPYWSLAGVGALAGLLSGVLGVGGGGIIAPLLLLLGYEAKKIAAITAFVVPFSSLSGFVTYWAIGAVDWHLLLVASVGGLIGASLGTKFMQKNLQASTVKKVLAVILLLMAVKMIIKLMG